MRANLQPLIVCALLATAVVCEVKIHEDAGPGNIALHKNLPDAMKQPIAGVESRAMYTGPESVVYEYTVQRATIRMYIDMRPFGSDDPEFCDRYEGGDIIVEQQLSLDDGAPLRTFISARADGYQACAYYWENVEQHSVQGAFSVIAPRFAAYVNRKRPSYRVMMCESAKSLDAAVTATTALREFASYARPQLKSRMREQRADFRY